jgi:hypothetical protein
MAHDGGLLKPCDPGSTSTPFHQHLFDFMPLPEQELVLDLVGAIRECNFAGKILDSLPDPGQERRSRSSGNSVYVCVNGAIYFFSTSGSLKRSRLPSLEVVLVGPRKEFVGAKVESKRGNVGRWGG